MLSAILFCVFPTHTFHISRRTGIGGIFSVLDRDSNRNGMAMASILRSIEMGCESYLILVLLFSLPTKIIFSVAQTWGRFFRFWIGAATVSVMAMASILRSTENGVCELWSVAEPSQNEKRGWTKQKGKNDA